MPVIRVLAIEDDPSHGRLIERMLALSPIGFQVTSATTLQEGLVSIREGRFNLILLDLNLPDAEGLDTLAAIRSADSALPIVVLTGREDVDLEQQTISLGAQCCLRKSEIDTQNLINAMHQAVRASRQRECGGGQQVEALLQGLEENLLAIETALVELSSERLDPPQQDAVRAIRSHVGQMQERIRARHRERWLR